MKRAKELRRRRRVERTRFALTLAFASALLAFGCAGPRIDATASERSAQVAGEHALGASGGANASGGMTSNGERDASRGAGTGTGDARGARNGAGASGGANSGAGAVSGEGASMSTPAPSRIPSSNADAAALEALDAAFVHVETLDPARNTLWIDASPATQLADDALAKLLTPVLARVEHLGLARTNAGERTLGLLANAPELTRLDLSGTRVDTPVLAALAGHAKLAELVVARTKLDAKAVDVLATLHALRTLHAWRSGLDAKALERLHALRPELAIDDGTNGAAAPVEVEPEVCVVPSPAAATNGNPNSAPSASPAAASGATSALKPVNTTCPVSGSPVNAAYSIVFEGRVIGFCCPNCPTKFWADPASYTSKLPQ